VLGFLLLSAAATPGFVDKTQTADLANLSRWAFLVTFAGVGLQTDLRQMSRQGWGPLFAGAVGELAIAAITLAMVSACLRSDTGSEACLPEAALTSSSSAGADISKATIWLQA
jgi:hypothetical protein